MIPDGSLRIVGAMADGIQRGGPELEHAKLAGRWQRACSASRARPTTSHSNNARAKPSNGDQTIAAIVFRVPPQTTALKPALAEPAPIRPPIRACELDDAIAPHQVSKFQHNGAHQRPEDHPPVDDIREMIPVPTVCATCRPKKRKAMKLKNAAQATASTGRQHPRRDDGGDGIGGVVQPVEKIEGDADDAYDRGLQLLTKRSKAEPPQFHPRQRDLQASGGCECRGPTRRRRRRD